MIDRMLGARNEREVEAEEEAADEWLKDNPGDIRVIAAHERLAERGVRVRDPERKVNRVTLAVFAAVFSSVALVGSALTGNLYAALAAGLLVTLPVTEFVRELLYERSGDGVEPRDGEG
ncbi:hypothetical protein BH24ACT19_BH24ACT19_19550 [soil metagenome]